MNRVKHRVELFYFIFFVIFISNCQENSNFDSLVKHYYSTGELEHEIAMKDSLLHGLSTTYYKNGKIMYEKYFFEDVPIDHHYYYSEEGELLAYNFYDIRGNLRYQLFADTMIDSYSQEGKSIYIQGTFNDSYSEGDSISLIPMVANPFKSKCSIILLTKDDRINRSFEFMDSNSLLFLYSVRKGNNPIMFISEVNDGNGQLFERDTISLTLIGK